MNRTLKKATLYFTVCLMCLITLFGSASAVAVGTEENSAEPQVSVTGNAVTLHRFKTTQLEAEVTGTDATPEITWKSSDEKLATVDGSGKVKGKNVGRVMISATADIDGKAYTGYYALDIIEISTPMKDYMVNKSVFSYKYNYVDNYYYTTDKDCWQEKFGFSRFYDLMAPYFALMEYDYIRVFFPYEGREFMVQFWKGQYTPVLFGGEVGVYTREDDGKEVGIFTFFHKAEEEYWPTMEMTVYQEQLNGEYERILTREYDKYWWITGFRPGHLRQVEPADELKLVARITFTDEKIAELFSEGMKECGFKEAMSKDSVETDGFYREGSDVYVDWQYISEAENTIPIKATGLVLVLLNILAFICAILCTIGLGSLVIFLLVIIF